MSDLFQGPLSPFDLVILAVVVVSAVMSLGRGLIREASSVISFIIGGIVAWIALALFHEPLSSVIPESWPPITAAALLIIVGFLAAYSLAAFVGGRLSRLIHASPEIGLIDRLAGAAFGVARGLLAAVLFVLLMQQVLPDDAMPSFISRSQSYRLLDVAASWIRDIVPGFVEKARDTIATSPLESVDDTSN